MKGLLFVSNNRILKIQQKENPNLFVIFVEVKFHVKNFFRGTCQESDLGLRGGGGGKLPVAFCLPQTQDAF